MKESSSNGEFRIRPTELGEDINDREAPGSFKEPFWVQRLWLLGVGGGQSHIHQVWQQVLSPYTSHSARDKNLSESFSARPCSFPKEYRSKIFQRKGKLEPCHASDDSDAARQRNSCRISGSRPNLGRASTRSRRVKHGYDKMSQTHQVLSNSEANINKPEMGHVIHFINLLPSCAGAVGGN